MNDLITKAQALLAQFLSWAEVEILSYQSLIQFGAIILLLLFSRAMVSWLKPDSRIKLEKYSYYQKIKPYLLPLYVPILWLITLLIVQQVAAAQEQDIYVLRTAVSLLFVWIVIRIATNLIESREIARIVRLVAWGLAALNIVGLLVPFLNLLDQTSFSVGEGQVSILDVITGILSLIFLLWAAFFLASLSEGWLKKLPTVNPSARVLLSKMIRILLVSIAFLFAVSSVGIDLTVFAVFGGAIGVGLGFGLQKVVSNFISGVILLMDRSIKPGDVVEISGTYGRINKLAGRYTSVISRDGREHLIPNEDMVTQTVINWTFSNRLIRRHLPVGISYKSDLEKAMALMIEAANEAERVMDEPEAKVLIKGFGDNAIDLELRMWIRDAKNGVSNIASEVYLNIWNKFKDNGIEFPYPQRDIHIVSQTKADTPL